MANIRAQNYSLKEMDWMTVKLKAGKIVPALATTTAAIAGLQTIELLKILKNLPVNKCRNSFLNLAVPTLLQSEPIAAQEYQINEDISVNIWNRWEIANASKDTTLGEILADIDTKYLHGNLEARGVIYGSTPLYLHALESALKPDAKNMMEYPVMRKKMKDLLDMKEGKCPPFVNLTVTLVAKGDEKLIEHVPEVRVYFTKYYNF